MTLTFTVTQFRALLCRLSQLLVGGGTVTVGPVRIVVVVVPGKPDEHKEPIAP